MPDRGKTVSVPLELDASLACETAGDSGDEVGRGGRQRAPDGFPPRGTGRRRTAGILQLYMEILGDTAAIFSGSVAGDARIHAFLRRPGRATGVSRVCLAGVARKPGTGEVCLRIQCEWADEPVGSPKEEGRCISCRDLPPGWAERLAAGLAIHGSLPASSGPVLMVPVFCGSKLRGVLEFRGYTGRRRWRRSEISALKAAAGILGSVVRDSRSCEALHTAETCYRTIVEDLTDPLCRLSPDGTITYANDLFCALCSRERGGVIGMPVQDVLPPGIAENLSVPGDLPRTTNPIVTHEFRFPGADGDERWYLSVWRAIFDNGGAVCGYQVIGHDITAQKTREQMLHEEMQRTSALLRIAARLNGNVELDAMLDALCEETARVLRVPAVVIFLYEHHRDLLVPARSFGVPEEARESLPFIPRTIYEREVGRQGPVFAIPDLVPRMNKIFRKRAPEKPPRTLASAAIFHKQTLIGALNVMTFDAPRSFSLEDLALLNGIADQAALAIVNARLFEERTAYERRLQALFEEKTALLKEVHHRVKNNLQVISSLLSLQGRLIENAETRECIRESENRVKSLALVYESLYRSESIVAVDIGAYTRRLANDLIRSYALPAHVSVAVETAETIILPVDAAIPLGLILNELVSNSLKHGFAGRHEGVIAIRIARLPDRQLTVEYRDDGVGRPPDVVTRLPATLGLQLVRILVEQLDGTVAFRQGEPGTVVEITVSDGAGEEVA